jgi:hypothetical protein
VRGLGIGYRGHIIREIKEGLAGFEKAEIVHERRAPNVDAHRLTKNSLYESLARHAYGFFLLRMEFVPTISTYEIKMVP